MLFASKNPAAVAALLFSAQAFSQVIERVYPLFATVERETHFEAHGQSLPHQQAPEYGLKIATDPPQMCGNPKRTRPLTETTYFFSCTFPKVHPASISIRIYNKSKEGSGTVLWKGAIQILSDAPVVDKIRVRTGQHEAYTRFDCDPAGICLHMQGLLTPSTKVQIDVTGKNLPHTLVVESDACSNVALASSPWQTQRRLYTCQVKKNGKSGLRVATAAAKAGGAVLFERWIDITE